MFENLSVFKMSAAMARHAGARQAVVAQNIAHSDTPGYVARDMPDFSKTYLPSEAATGMQATRARHLNGASDAMAALASVEMKDQASPNGNQVSLETEMLKSVAAKRQHDRALAIYKNALDVLRSTLRTS